MLRQTTSAYSNSIELGSDTDLLALHELNPERYPFLLQSTATGGKLGRYDILFAWPGERLVLDATGSLDTPESAAEGERFLDALDDWWSGLVVNTAPSPDSFAGGWFLYLGYELAAEVEPSLELERDPILPTAFAVRCPAAVIHDHVNGSIHLVVENDASVDIEQTLDDARRAQQPVLDCIERTPPRAIEEEPGRFLDAVRRAKEHIAGGDIYQANLSRQWQVRVDTGLDPVCVYDQLRRANPAPFAGLARFDDTAIISSSPERLLELRDGMASTRPIAGTRPRSDDQHQDESLSTELFANDKERAEHVMLIDLERNDLGRICEAGTVEVDEMMVLESYAHVHHIVSNVSGRLAAGTTPGQAIRAVFPGGTITGCPKVRCMQIIDELEASPRGAYTGSFGYLNRDGSLDLNILIRTMVMRGNDITLRAGSGIVADSQPDAELDETRAKAKGLLRAVT